jgi:hypothetical protein
MHAYLARVCRDCDCEAHRVDAARLRHDRADGEGAGGFKTELPQLPTVQRANALGEGVNVVVRIFVDDETRLAHHASMSRFGINFLSPRERRAV